MIQIWESSFIQMAINAKGVEGFTACECKSKERSEPPWNPEKQPDLKNIQAKGGSQRDQDRRALQKMRKIQECAASVRPKKNLSQGSRGPRAQTC